MPFPLAITEISSSLWSELFPLANTQGLSVMETVISAGDKTCENLMPLLQFTRLRTLKFILSVDLFSSRPTNSALVQLSKARALDFLDEHKASFGEQAPLLIVEGLAEE
jgi:hypothetical protein